MSSAKNDVPWTFCASAPASTRFAEKSADGSAPAPALLRAAPGRGLELAHACGRVVPVVLALAEERAGPEQREHGDREQAREAVDGGEEGRAPRKRSQRVLGTSAIALRKAGEERSQECRLRDGPPRKLTQGRERTEMQDQG
jgi:hypothetical protein